MTHCFIICSSFTRLHKTAVGTNNDHHTLNVESKVAWQSSPPKAFLRNKRYYCCKPTRDRSEYRLLQNTFGISVGTTVSIHDKWWKQPPFKHNSDKKGIYGSRGCHGAHEKCRRVIPQLTQAPKLMGDRDIHQIQ